MSYIQTAIGEDDTLLPNNRPAPPTIHNKCDYIYIGNVVLDNDDMAMRKSIELVHLLAPCHILPNHPLPLTPPSCHTTHKTPNSVGGRFTIWTVDVMVHRSHCGWDSVVRNDCSSFSKNSTTELGNPAS